MIAIIILITIELKTKSIKVIISSNRGFEVMLSFALYVARSKPYGAHTKN